MKKVLCILFAALMSLSLLGCSQAAPVVSGAPSSGADPAGSMIPSSDTPETEQEENAAPVQFTCNYAFMALTLPQGWSYETLPLDETEVEPEPGGSVGLRFWPDADPELELRLICDVFPIGLCGTGVTIEDEGFANGLTATIYSETTGDSYWAAIIFDDLPGYYYLDVSTTSALWEEYQSTVMGILDTARLGGDAIPQSQALSIAEEALPEAAGKFYAPKFDIQTGAWTFCAGDNMEVQVSEEGEVLYIALSD